MKERVIFFYELIAIEPILINSLFTKGKYFGYVLNDKDGNRTVLKSSYLCDLDIFISEPFPSVNQTNIKSLREYQ